MIRNTKQNWTKGATVKVGFLTLVVQAAIATPGDHLPDVYFLANQRGDTLYQFIPHHGLTRISVDEAAERVAYLRQCLEGIAASEVNQAMQRMQMQRRFNEIFVEAA